MASGYPYPKPLKLVFRIEDDKCAIGFEWGEGNGKVITVYIVCISVEKIDDDHLEVKPNFHPESPYRPHHATEYDFQHTVDVPNTNAHLNDNREGFTETANKGNSSHRHFGFLDTTENENVYVHEVSEPQFDHISDQVPIWSDDQFTPIQRLVPPPSVSYSINFGKVAPRPVDMCITVGELFETCIDGFLSSIRPIIAIDVTFLKGPHAGVLFVAVFMDGNDQIFPLAFDVGDSETNEAWEWFLTRLHHAVGKVDDLVIVSDMKNSIITGVEKVFPNSFPRAHMRYI
ncbi:hypothetical protein Ddye_000793 [Dipteronia dyeriana]|uniref:MULE transposase domain-containing protein n=1 Tax=Dipteronia dyeriana TaxID=168575 RepID=A0AAD9XMD2_9ROSI|nr:hypothetical protein Ddye_000793 [Dipteronia dyeriana]